MAGKIDRRQARTKQLLYRALIELMKERGIGGITVTDIANKADINRGTFYLHYRDVPDMLDNITEDWLQDIKDMFAKLDIIDLLKYAQQDEPYQEAMNLLEKLASNADFVQLIFGPNGNTSVLLRIKEMMTEHCKSRIASWQSEETDRRVPLDYLISYITSANLGVIMHWIETGMKESPRDVVHIMTRMISSGPVASAGLRNQETVLR